MVQEFSQLLSPFSVEYSKSSIDFCFWVIPISEKVGVEEEGIAELEKSTEAGRRIRVLNGWNLKLVTLPKSITIIVNSLFFRQIENLRTFASTLPINFLGTSPPNQARQRYCSGRHLL